MAKKPKGGFCGNIVKHFYDKYMENPAPAAVYKAWTRRLSGFRKAEFAGQRIFTEEEIIKVIDWLIDNGIPHTEFPGVLSGFPNLVEAIVDGKTDTIMNTVNYIRNKHSNDNEEEFDYSNYW